MKLIIESNRVELVNELGVVLDDSIETSRTCYLEIEDTHDMPAIDRFGLMIKSALLDARCNPPSKIRINLGSGLNIETKENTTQEVVF
ncbi:hypothetical protein MLD52_09050 [Puniceicoccaceae bacterium K14]|nr:hypothetical protein [Puniceicoccaceae bacterium K14]